MDIKDPRYKSLVQEFSNDSEFLDFSPEEQDSILDIAAQKRYGKTPNPTNFLANAIQASRINDLPITGVGMLPSDKDESFDFLKVAGRQVPMIRGQDVNFATTGPTGIGLNMAGIKKADSLIEPPSTPYGKNLENAADIAPWASLGLSGLTSLSKGISKSFRSAPVKREIEDLIFQGSNKVKTSVDDMFKQYNSKFGEGLSKLKSNMTSDDFADIVSQTTDELGRYDKSSDILTSELQKLLYNSGETFDVSSVQSKSKRILQMLGNDNRAKAIFYKNFLDKIPDTVEGLKELKAAHAPIYQIAKESRQLGKGLMRKIASGKVGPEELSSAKSAESKLGIDILGPIEKKSNELQKIILNKKLGKAALSLTGAGAGGLAILNALKGKD